MEAAIGIGAARWAVGRALGPITSGLLEPWAASSALGTKIHELKMELLYAQGMLNNARAGRDVRNPALAQLLLELRQLAYLADDVLDELEYFRIQDELKGTFQTMDPEGLKGLLVHAQHTVKSHARKLKPPLCLWPTACHGDKEHEDGKQGCLSRACAHGGCMPKVIASSIRAVGNRLPCSHSRMSMQDDASDASNMPPMHGRRLPCAYKAQFPALKLDRLTTCNNEVGCMPKVITSSIRAVGKHLPCRSLPSMHDNESAASRDSFRGSTSGIFEHKTEWWAYEEQQKKHMVQSPSLNFDRVGMSRKMSDIVEKLKPICAKVSTILNLELLGFTRTTTPETPFVRPETTSNNFEPKIYGRETHINNIVYDITDGKYSTKDITVLPIFGLGGIGKTTFTQHIYNKVKTLFHVRIWICVSHSFNANRLIRGISNQIPGGSKEMGTAASIELIEKAIQSEKFLFVLDDIWSCPEDEWNKILSPFRKGTRKGNMVIVTTRFLGVAKTIESKDCSIKLNRLQPKECMAMFESCVFGEHQPWKDHDGLRKPGEEIVTMLKGSPLAVKTVGRLLRTQLNIDHWNSILESKEWELQTSKEDIMPALNLSYNYLPFPVQQCFSFCGLFPEDYKFRSEELIHFWIGLGLICISDQNKRLEYTGQRYIDILVDHGFFEQVESLDDIFFEIGEVNPRYVIHDLLHELAVKVSSYECLSINSSNLRAINIPVSVRHMSIIVDSTVVTNKTIFKNFMSDLATLGKILKAENLHTLMLFGRYHGSFVNTLCDLFRKAKALRVISLLDASYNVEDLLKNFSNLLHLRYLRFSDVQYSITSIPESISRLYHLIVLDVGSCWGRFSFPQDMSNLVKMRHYIGQGYKFSPHISMVGKLKFLQDLSRFEVGREDEGFELEQLGKLQELSGSLGIYNLENVKSIEEVDEAKLAQKRHLHWLTLAWRTKRCDNGPRQQDVLENLKPHINLTGLCISGNGGATYPSWLDADLNLEHLELRDVSWNKLPIFGTSQGFQILKSLKLVNLPKLKKWCGNGTFHLLPKLEKLVVTDCCKLEELPFSRSTCHAPGQAESMAWFPKLWDIDISLCPNLMPLPPVPWTSSLREINIEQVRSDFKELSYTHLNEPELSITGKGGRDSTFWNVVAFGNLTDLESIVIDNCAPVPLHHLQVLRCLKTMHIYGTDFLLPTERDSNAHYKISVKWLDIRYCSASGKELTQIISHFPYLSRLDLIHCNRVSGLGVAVEEQPKMSTPASTSANKMDEAKIRPQPTQTAGVVLLPPHIQRLYFSSCPQLSHVSTSIGKGTAAGGGLEDLRSLQTIHIDDCPILMSSNASFHFLFPSSLQTVTINRTRTSLTLPHLPNLTNLDVRNAPYLRGEDLLPLLLQGKLTDLSTYCAPQFFVGLKAAKLCGIRTIRTHVVAGFLVNPICDILSSSLTRLFLENNSGLERFTKAQEKALHMLTSLQELEISFFSKLQSGPAGLSGELHSLKKLRFWRCEKLQSLPKDSIPTSLEVLSINHCPQLRSVPKDGLENSSLRGLVLSDVSDELEKQCRKLQGTIPVYREEH